MRPGATVRPQKWSNVIDLFDNGWYSAVWGNYDNRKERCLGVRWNGNDTNEVFGYPNQGRNPLWYVEPPILHRQILLALQKELSNIKSTDRRDEYQRNIEIALSECR